MPLCEVALRIGASRAEPGLGEEHVEVAFLADAPRLPRAGERCVRHVADRKVHPDRAPLVDEHLLDLLAQPVAGRAHDADRGAHAVLRTDAVRARDPARAFEQALRAVGVVRLLRESRRRRPPDGELRGPGPRASEEQPLDDPRLGRREQERAPHRDITQDRMRRTGIAWSRELEGERLDAG